MYIFIPILAHEIIHTWSVNNPVKNIWPQTTSDDNMSRCIMYSDSSTHRIIHKQQNRDVRKEFGFTATWRTSLSILSQDRCICCDHFCRGAQFRVLKDLLGSDLSEVSTPTEELLISSGLDSTDFEECPNKYYHCC